jgi:hypothetical protein
MPDWKVFYRDDHHRDAQSTHTSKEAAIVQVLHLERRQHCRIQIIEGQNGELIDRETFERELEKAAPLSEAPASRCPGRGTCTIGANAAQARPSRKRKGGVRAALFIGCAVQSGASRL